MIPDLVSIIMPAYNCEGTLSDSVASVICQTFTNWELIIIDDGSSDRTLSIAEALGRNEPRIRILRSSRNSGVAQARNAGMQEARGRFLAFLDSDDLWLPHKLARQVAIMRERNLCFTFSQYRRLLPDGQLGPIIPIPIRIDYYALLKGNAIGCLTVMIDRSQIPPFSMINVGHEDLVAWLEILKRGGTAWGIQEDLARYRVSLSSISSKKWRSALWTWNIYRRTEQLSLLKSTFYFLLYSTRSLRIRADVLLRWAFVSTRHRISNSRMSNHYGE